MSETVKLIIEIPKEEYEFIKSSFSAQPRHSYSKMILNGIPLDDVKAEITALRYGSDTYKNAIDDVIEIIDSVGKGESK